MTRCSFNAYTNASLATIANSFEPGAPDANATRHRIAALGLAARIWFSAINNSIKWTLTIHVPKQLSAGGGFIHFKYCATFANLTITVSRRELLVKIGSLIGLFEVSCCYPIQNSGWWLNNTKYGSLPASGVRPIHNWIFNIHDKIDNRLVVLRNINNIWWPIAQLVFRLPQQVGRQWNGRRPGYPCMTPWSLNRIMCFSCSFERFKSHLKSSMECWWQTGMAYPHQHWNSLRASINT